MDHVQTVFKDLPHARAREGAQQDAGAAQRGHAADDARGHAVHLIGVAGVHVAHAGLRGQDQAHDHRAEGADQIGLGGGQYDVHARQPCRVHIGADGVDVAARAGLRQQEEEHQEYHQRDPEGVEHPGELAVIEEILEGVARLLADAGGDVVRVAVAVDDIADASRHEHGAQRGDEGRELELADQVSVDHADDQSAQYGQQDRQEGIHAPGHQRGGDHGAHAHHRADGQVDVARDHHEALADADQQIFGHGPQQVLDVHHREHLGVHDAKRHIYHDQADKSGEHRARAFDRQQPPYGALLPFLHTLIPRFHWPFYSRRRSRAAKSPPASLPRP